MRLVCVTLIGVGLTTSGYLLFRHFQLAGASGPVAAGFCSIVFQTNCDAALQSPVSKQLGLPLPAWGIVYYGVLTTWILLSWLLDESIQPEGALVALVVSINGALLSAVLLLAMLLGTAPFCPLCVVVHFINFGLVAAIYRMTGCPLRQLPRATLGATSVLVGHGPAGDTRASLKRVALLAVTLVAIILYQWSFIQEQLHPPAKFDVKDALASFAMGMRVEIPCSDEDPKLGADASEVRMVVFTDFQCRGCSLFARQIRNLVQRTDGGIELVFKHFPAGIACNAAVDRDRHPRACEAAWAAEAARRQEKFWPFHDALFEADLASHPVSLEGIAERAGLDLARFEADRRSEEVIAKVKADIELGNRLGVDATPCLFINGRRAPDVRAQSLHLFLASELAGRRTTQLRE